MLAAKNGGIYITRLSDFIGFGYFCGMDFHAQQLAIRTNN